MLQFDASRVLSDNFPRSRYVPFSGLSKGSDVVKGLHFGQRKLLLSEIEYLTAIHESKPQQEVLIVYAGAANGSHLPFLFSLFPTFKFVLIDPAPFCAPVAEIAAKGASGAVVELLNEFCTEELCMRLRREYGEAYVIHFISDIRSGVPSRMSNKENTAMIQADNALQRACLEALHAHTAMMKFHPPYPKCTDVTQKTFEADDDTPDSITYLDGSRLFGVWSPKSSSEVRLVVVFEGKELSERSYSCQEHEEQCYHYNTTDRYSRDCAAERLILERYVASVADGSTTGSVEELSKKMSSFLGFPLFTPIEKSFPECDARLLTLLYSTRDPAHIALYEPLSGKLSREEVIHLVEQYALRNLSPENLVVGGVHVGSEFWTVLKRGNLVEAYSIPPSSWNGAQKRPRLHSQNQNAPRRKDSHAKVPCSTLNDPRSGEES